MEHTGTEFCTLFSTVVPSLSNLLSRHEGVPPLKNNNTTTTLDKVDLGRGEKEFESTAYCYVQNVSLFFLK